MPMLDANLESFENMKENLRELDVDIHSIPIVLQYNKRDLKNIVPLEELNAKLNIDGLPFVESSAISGKGVFDTLKLASKHTLLYVKKKMVAPPQKKEPAPPSASVAKEIAPSPAPEPEASPQPAQLAKKGKEAATEPIREVSAAYLKDTSGSGTDEVPGNTPPDNPAPPNESDTRPQHVHSAPQLTMDDLLDEPEEPKKKKRGRKKLSPQKRYMVKKWLR